MRVRPAVLRLVGPMTLGALVITGSACSKTDSAAPPATAPATSAAPATTAPPATAPPTSRVTTTTVAAAPGEVPIVDYAFTPETITVKVGDTVTWTNRDEFDHWVLSDDKTTLDSQALATGQQYRKTFTTPGTVTYYCNIHNGMKGSVVVS